MTGAPICAYPSVERHVVTIEVQSFGEDGEYLLAVGHHDLTAFAEAAHREAERLYLGIEADEMPEPRHRWMRPWRRSDSETDEDFAWKQADDWQKFTDDPTEEGAVAITLLAFDL